MWNQLLTSFFVSRPEHEPDLFKNGPSCYIVEQAMLVKTKNKKPSFLKRKELFI